MSGPKFARVLLLSCRILVAVAIVLAAVVFLGNKRAPVVHAQSSAVTTDFGNITSYMAGWYSNIVMITTNATYQDNGCNGGVAKQYSTLDGYEGNPAFHAALLGALLSNKKVAVTVQGCAYGHPQIVAVTIQP